MEQNLFCNYGRGHNWEQSCEIILKFGPVVQDKMLCKVNTQWMITMAFSSGELKWIKSSSKS